MHVSVSQYNKMPAAQKRAVYEGFQKRQLTVAQPIAEQFGFHFHMPNYRASYSNALEAARQAALVAHKEQFGFHMPSFVSKAAHFVEDHAAAEAKAVAAAAARAKHDIEVKAEQVAAAAKAKALEAAHKAAEEARTKLFNLEDELREKAIAKGGMFAVAAKLAPDGKQMLVDNGRPYVRGACYKMGQEFAKGQAGLAQVESICNNKWQEAVPSSNGILRGLGGTVCGVLPSAVNSAMKGAAVDPAWFGTSASSPSECSKDLLTMAVGSDHSNLVGDGFSYRF